ncbi:hypothetical protein FB45DRAFT_450305 [Roridomyces roridus]|uniref:Uncharacterized protein n=1 Tax=Roridomyces roridus TaxID=1738132 RepID=A0AAD7C3M9_9AGAR|nr:hypothetical protein FB45DRAFT_450305 [Roridomyces roridus]
MGTIPARNTILTVPNSSIPTLDDSDDDSVQQAASHIPELGTLIVNAGVGKYEPVTISPTTALASCLDVNLLGAHRTICASSSHAQRVASSSSPLPTGRPRCRPRQERSDCQGYTPSQRRRSACSRCRRTYRRPYTSRVGQGHGSNAGTRGMPPATSAKTILELVQGLKTEDSATFFQFDGEKLPW